MTTSARTMQPRRTDTVSPAIEVRISTRRKKTAVAYWEGDRIVVVLPSHIRGAQREEWVAELVRRVTKNRPNRHASDDELFDRAVALGARYLDGVRPDSIRWVTNQHKRWGSCTPTTREIRISSRLQAVPGWVLDCVVVHELAHLIEARHTPRFRALERRHPRQGDADQFLAGYHLGLSLHDSCDGTWGTADDDRDGAAARDA